MPTDHPEESPHRQPHLPPPGNPLPHLLSAQPASTITSAHHAIIRLGRAPTRTHANKHTHTRSHARAQREHGQAAPIDRWAACGTRRSNPRPTGAALRDRQVSPPNVWITPKNPQGTQTMTDPHMVETWGRIDELHRCPLRRATPFLLALVVLLLQPRVRPFEIGLERLLHTLRAFNDAVCGLGCLRGAVGERGLLPPAPVR